jgi:cell division protein ZapE
MLEQIYSNLIGEGELQLDDSQLSLVRKLDKYCSEINAPDKLFNKLVSSLNRSTSLIKRGMYIWGDVGRGKSMLMDMFLDNLDTNKKNRVHFYAFMANFHKSLNDWRKKHGSSEKSADPIPQIVKGLAKDYKVICFDELQVNNIADAMIVSRLFESMIKEGIYIFITSNRIPSDLYKDGLQRERFLPFIEVINNKLEVFELNNNKDYRMDNLGKIEHSYICPLGEDADGEMERVIKSLVGSNGMYERQIHVDEGRDITAYNTYGSLAVFSFRELCEVSYGAVDYLALCKNFKTLIVRNIPKLSNDNHNEALRFITLIDCMYENNTKLICSAADQPQFLYNGGKNSFEFKRTISRLNEMQSDAYFLAKTN